MNKKKMLLITTIGILVIALAAVGLVYAQEPTPQSDNGEYTPGQCDGTGPHGYGRGRFGPGNGPDGEEGPLHEYMIGAMADALGLSEDELEAGLEGGETLCDIGQDLGYEAEELRDLMLDAREAAIEEALNDGAITEEQATFMLERLEEMREKDFGAGSGPCAGFGGGPRHGPRPGFGPKGNQNNQ